MDDVSRETLRLLKDYESMVLEWTPKINLVSPSQKECLWDRHIRDSAQIDKIAVKPDTWLDIGSGAGFPGLVIAILRRGTALRMTLVESDARKCAFLRAVIRKLGLNAEVVNKRVEAMPPRPFDVISARAVARLVRLLELAVPFSGPQTKMIFPKGSSASEEIAEARGAWSFRCEEIPSETDAAARILVIDEVSRAC